jgi:hypothetical protein
MSIFDGLNIDIDTLIEGNKSEVLNKELSNTAKKNLDIQKRAGVEEIADQEEIIRLVYLIEEAPFDQSTSSQKRSVKDVIKTYRDDPNFFTQTGTESPIGKCKHILFNLLSSSEVAASIKRKYSPKHNWPSNFTTSDLHFKPPSSMDEAEVPARKKTRVADTKVVQGPTLLEPCEEVFDLAFLFRLKLYEKPILSSLSVCLCVCFFISSFSLVETVVPRFEKSEG